MLASQKVACALVAFPIASFVWTTCLFWTLKAGFHFTYKRALTYSLIFYVLWPVYCYSNDMDIFCYYIEYYSGCSIIRWLCKAFQKVSRVAVPHSAKRQAQSATGIEERAEREGWIYLQFPCFIKFIYALANSIH